MTPDEYRYHSCLRKRAYPDRRQARRAALAHQTNLGGRRVVHYHCEFSDHWHVGHSPNRGRRTA